MAARTAKTTETSSVSCVGGVSRKGMVSPHRCRSLTLHTLSPTGGRLGAQGGCGDARQKAKAEFERDGVLSSPFDSSSIPRLFRRGMETYAGKLESEFSNALELI